MVVWGVGVAIGLILEKTMDADKALSIGFMIILILSLVLIAIDIANGHQSPSFHYY